MIQLDVLSGKKAGTSIVARRFPFQVGRAVDSALCLDDPGVFERHCTLTVRRGQGVALALQPGALATVNQAAADEVVLKNGDIIEFGAVKLRFTLAPAPQRGQAWREILTWVGLAFLCVAQVALIYWLLG